MLVASRPTARDRGVQRRGYEPGSTGCLRGWRTSRTSSYGQEYDDEFKPGSTASTIMSQVLLVVLRFFV